MLPAGVIAFIEKFESRSMLAFSDQEWEDIRLFLDLSLSEFIMTPMNRIYYLLKQNFRCICYYAAKKEQKEAALSPCGD